ncbi:MAG: dehydrogenase [Acidobacteria bacterium]|nr:dehydrogenase [Acidobacteriota bacterium]
MSRIFRVGITPDFYIDAKGRFEDHLHSQLGSVAGIEVVAMPEQPGKTASAHDLDQFDAIFSLALRYTRESFRGLQRLALIARWGVGYDMIDVAASTEANVLLTITPEAVRRPVAEAIVAFIFMLAKNTREKDRVVRERRWRPDLKRLGTCIPGNTLGSLGCGNIAQEMFRITASLGFARYIAFDPYVDPAVAKALNVQLVTLDELFRQSDYLAVNCFLNESTKGIVGEAQLRSMKPTAYLINTARGPIVNQAALARALKENWIAGAGIDVFEDEPPDPSDPLLDCDNAVFAPHALAWTEEIARDNTIEACRNIIELAHGGVPHGAVNRDVLTQPGFQQKLERYKS